MTWGQRWEGRTRPQSTVREILFPTLEQTARAAFAGGGPAAAKKALRAYAASRTGRPYEIIFNRLGYALLQTGLLDAAVAVFELNTELFPGSFNVLDSLGEAHKAAGRREKAIECYQKSLELNPENANAAVMLMELGAE